MGVPFFTFVLITKNSWIPKKISTKFELLKVIFASVRGFPAYASTYFLYDRWILFIHNKSKAKYLRAEAPPGKHLHFKDPISLSNSEDTAEKINDFRQTFLTKFMQKMGTNYNTMHELLGW